MPQSNFDFLRKDFEPLFGVADKAERYVHDDPETCLAKLRKFSELFAKEVAARSNINVAKVELDTLLLDLRRGKCLDDNAYRILDRLRRRGNYAVHNDCDSISEAAESLDAAFRVAVWLRRKYGKGRFDPRPFKLPAKEADARKELEVKVKRLESEVAKIKRTATAMRDAHAEERARLMAERDEWKAIAETLTSPDGSPVASLIAREPNVEEARLERLRRLAGKRNVSQRHALMLRHEEASRMLTLAGLERYLATGLR